MSRFFKNNPGPAEELPDDAFNPEELGDTFKNESRLDIPFPQKPLVALLSMSASEVLETVINARTQQYETEIAALYAERDEKIRRATEKVTRDYSAAEQALTNQFNVDIDRLRIIYATPETPYE